MRDYFAAQAMVGFLAEAAESNTYGRLSRTAYTAFAEDCYDLADAMLKAGGYESEDAEEEAA